MANWYRAALWTPTSTATVTLTIGEWIAYFASLASDPNFPWEIASSSNTGTLNYLVFRKKGGAAGRGIIFGGTTVPNNAAMATGVSASTNIIYLGWSPTSTVNTPNDYTLGTPFAYPDFSGGMVACAVAFGNRFYAYTNGDQLLFSLVNLNLNQVLFGCGPVFTDRSNTTFYQGIFSSPTPFTTPASMSGRFGVSIGTGSSSNIGNSSDARAFSVNQWVRLVGLSTYNEYTAVNPSASVFVDSSNNVTFYPFFLATCGDVSSVLLKVYCKIRNLAVGTNKIFGYQWIDNGSLPRGYYLGYHTTQANDVSGLTLTNDDM